MAEAEDRTEAPTERRRLKAREDGQVALSREVVVTGGLAAGVVFLAVSAPRIGRALLIHMQACLTDFSVSPTQALAAAATQFTWAVAPFLCATIVMATLSTLVQTGFAVNLKALAPDMSRVGVRRGLKRLLGIEHAVEVVKALVKLAVLIWAASSALSGAWTDIVGSLVAMPDQAAGHTWQALLHLMQLVLAVQFGIGILDVSWTRRRFEQRLRMSREDVRQELKESDGDPRIKARIRQLRLSRARRRMLAAVSKATVVVTNPTHYAVALVYQRGGSAAPKVVAKGVDEVAARIREAATRAGVPLIANPVLARALYVLPLDAEVPPEHFRVVAEMIAYVWGLRRARSSA